MCDCVIPRFFLRARRTQIFPRLFFSVFSSSLFPRRSLRCRVFFLCVSYAQTRSRRPFGTFTLFESPSMSSPFFQKCSLAQHRTILRKPFSFRMRLSPHFSRDSRYAAGLVHLVGHWQRRSDSSLVATLFCPFCKLPLLFFVWFSFFSNFLRRRGESFTRGKSLFFFLVHRLLPTLAARVFPFSYLSCRAVTVSSKPSLLSGSDGTNLA